MSNHRARTWDHRGSKPLGSKLLPLGHHLDGYRCANVIGVISVGVDGSSVMDDGVDLSWVVGVTGDNMDSDSVKVRTFCGSKDGDCCGGGGDDDDNE